MGPYERDVTGVTKPYCPNDRLRIWNFVTRNTLHTTFNAAAAQFETYDDQEISVVNQTTAVLADERDIEHVFAFDNDFRTLGFSLVPDEMALER
ncbi:hypothetical protein ACLI4Z_16905 (plasmid) [Natrialbaceae archaeon A-arb3/5]